MRYQRVASEAELIAALSEPNAAILAGGTDLLVRIRGGQVRPDLLVDVASVTTLKGIRRTESSIEIGAAIPESDILASSVVRNALPLLAKAVGALGSVQIRNRGTLGGNLVNASPAADSAVPLLLYDAELVVVGAGGERTVPLEAFLVGPGKTVLGSGEFVRTVRVPFPETGTTTFYHKVGKRRALTIAIASLGAVLRIEDGRVTDARFAAGSVAPTPVRLRAVEEYARGSTTTEESIEEAARLAAQAVSPISDVRASAEYRSEVIAELVARAFQAASSSD